MKIRTTNISRCLSWLIVISVALRAFLALFVEFGNDEVYYWTYALYPDWSHFDHPPMVGWLIQFFTLNLRFDGEFFCRLASVVFTGVNTLLMFRLGQRLKDDVAGLYAAFLYNASLYGFVITGVFILPDTPLMFFMLLAVERALCFFSNDGGRDVDMLLFGLYSGLALLSKYTGAFLWLGVALYLISYRRDMLRRPVVYLSALISLLCLCPIIIWNIQNDFISFTFHGDRVGLFGTFQPEFFLRELLGEFLYNNPINFVLIVIAVVALLRKKFSLNLYAKRLLLLISLPFIGLFWWFSFSRELLAHWTAPAFTLLLLVAACHLSEKTQKDNIIKIHNAVVAAVTLLVVVLTLAVTEIKTGFVDLKVTEDSQSVRYRGEGDFTMDMYGWRQMKEKFSKIRQKAIENDVMNSDDDIIALGWYPAANIDYYCAKPLNINVLGMNTLHHLHKYSWITNFRGGLQLNHNYWFLDDSHDYYKPEKYFPEYFEKIVPIDTIAIMRGDDTAKYFFVYKLENLKKEFITEQ